MPRAEEELTAVLESSASSHVSMVPRARSVVLPKVRLISHCRVDDGEGVIRRWGSTYRTLCGLRHARLMTGTVPAVICSMSEVTMERDERAQEELRQQRAASASSTQKCKPGRPQGTVEHSQARDDADLEELKEEMRVEDARKKSGKREFGCAV